MSTGPPGRRLCSLGWGLVLGPLAFPLASQPLPVRHPIGPPVVAPATFGRVNAVHELPDGRVVVVDHPGRNVLLVDFLAGLLTPVGRSGSGPGEYQLPERLISLPGDSVGIWDAANSRFLVLGLDGIPAALRGPTGRSLSSAPRLGSLPLARAGDREGALYGLGGMTERPDGSEGRPILRWTPREGAPTEVVGFLPVPPPPGAQRTQAGYITPATAMVPFLPGPTWAVSAAGVVAIVHPDPYRVELLPRQGRQILGPVVAFQPLPVTDGHRRAYLEEWAELVPVLVFRRGESRSEIRMQPRGNPGRSIPWPSRLPPFLRDAARFAPDGTLWVERTTPADAPPRFDLFDAEGRRTTQAELPAVGMRLVGFGKGVVYLVRRDAQGEERLERWRW